MIARRARERLRLRGLDGCVDDDAHVAQLLLRLLERLRQRAAPHAAHDVEAHVGRWGARRHVELDGRRRAALSRRNARHLAAVEARGLERVAGGRARLERVRKLRNDDRGRDGRGRRRSRRGLVRRFAFVCVFWLILRRVSFVCIFWIFRRLGPPVVLSDVLVCFLFVRRRLRSGVGRVRRHKRWVHRRSHRLARREGRLARRRRLFFCRSRGLSSRRRQGRRRRARLVGRRERRSYCRRWFLCRDGDKCRET
mmetsp:Transcript_14286/g.42615  ORF Transcript_14286/g.42615 Transcript_14286/m.42615 type:complete len:253 (-) Transcript_14286:115-873(-)